VAWVLYDWANSAFWATIVLVFPIYYVKVASAQVPAAVANARYAWATTISMMVSALLSPVLGAIADYRAAKKRMLLAFLALGVLATAAMFFVREGDWVFASLTYILANVGVTGSITFYDSLLPHVAREDEMDRVSTAGYAMGYLGSGMLMALNLAWIQWPHSFGIPDSATASRLSFLSVAVWWAVFSIPLLRHVGEPPRILEAGEAASQNPVSVGFRRVVETFRELRQYRHALLFLIAFLVYNDGIGTIIRMASPYGAEIGLPESEMIGALLLVQFVGVPFSFLFGALADRIGAKRALYLAIGLFVVITVQGFVMSNINQFRVLSFLVGMVIGGAQALSRSVFATLIPRQKSGEFFGFFSVFDKFAGVFGPAMFATVVELTGASRYAILGLILFFAVGGTLLYFVDLEAGQKHARAEEARLQAA
jgi:UMF1 family MFS transporter